MTETDRFLCGVGPEPAVPHPLPAVHLGGQYGGTACRTWSKFTTTSAGSVTCEACKATWAFAAGSRKPVKAK